VTDIRQDNPCDTDGVAHDFDLVLERIIDATPDTVFRCYTDPDLLSQWFAPRPWRISNAVIEPRPGGRMSFVMHGPDGEQFPNTGVYLEVIPNRLLVSTDAFAPGWKPAGQPFMVARVELEPDGDGQTRLRASASHWNQAAMDQHLAMGFHEGWGQVADQLNQLVRTI